MENCGAKLLDGRQESPRVWKKLGNGFEIQELEFSRVDEVIDVIKVRSDHFCTVVLLRTIINNLILT